MQKQQMPTIFNGIWNKNSKILKIEGIRPFDYKIIQWEIIKYCNYNCSYCDLHADNVYIKNFEEYCEWLNINLKDCVLQFFGGEPTLHPKFLEILDLIKIPFGIYTNLSKSMYFWKKIIKYRNLHHIYISVHISQIHDIHEFEEKLQLIKNSNVIYNINVMLEHDSIHNAIQKFQKYNKIHESVSLTRITGDYEYNCDILQYSKYILDKQKFIVHMRNNDSFLSSNFDTAIDYINTKNFKCDMISRYNFIDIYGKIWNYCRKQYLMDVFDKDSSILNKNFIVCKQISCPMYCYIHGTKECLIK